MENIWEIDIDMSISMSHSFHYFYLLNFLYTIIKLCHDISHDLFIWAINNEI